MLLKVFWEAHDPTQGMRQGNDVGTQYRSGIYTYGNGQNEARKPRANAIRRRYQRRATAASPPRWTGRFYFAEDYHQQYLAKNPWGSCGLGSRR